MLFQAKDFKNRRIQEVLPQGSWKGKRCFLIGGGPSLRGFDWSKLKGELTIGINRAYEVMDPTILFSMDTRFLNWILKEKYGREAKEKFLSLRQVYKIWLLTYRANLPGDIYIVPVFKGYKYSLKAFNKKSLEEGLAHGNNSGYAALNLAYLLGANPIYLLGFDCKHQGPYSHWHKGHPLKQNERVTRKFISFFRYAHEALKDDDVEIINLNINSSLDFFPKQNLEEVL